MTYQLVYHQILSFLQMTLLFFSVVHDRTTSANELNNDLLKLTSCAYQWKIRFKYVLFKHGFLDSLNPICSCGLDVETTCHYSHHCPNFTNERSIILNIVSTINESSLTSCDASIVKLLLNGEESLDLETNTLILNATVDFILSSERFDGPFM